MTDNTSLLLAYLLITSSLGSFSVKTLQICHNDQGSNFSYQLILNQDLGSFNYLPLMLYLFLALKTLIKAGLGVTVSIVSMNHTMYAVTPVSLQLNHYVSKINKKHFSIKL